MTTTMPFGKHKGQPLAGLPAEYLTWVATLDNIRDPLLGAVNAELRRRQPFPGSNGGAPKPAPVAAATPSAPPTPSGDRDALAELRGIREALDGIQALLGVLVTSLPGRSAQ